MMHRFSALIFALFVFFSAGGALAATHGPAGSYDELLSLAASAKDGDTLLVSGAIIADSRPLSAEASLRLTGAPDGASLSGLSLSSASVIFSGVALEGGVSIQGKSNVHLARGTVVDGGLSFSGSGTLLLDPGSVITGAPEQPGVMISQQGGDLYISLDGTILGGDGETAGAAAVVDPLNSGGALMITGTLTGGSGGAFGGNALNLHNLSGNAFITVDGKLTGGSGAVGGVGLQLITAEGSMTAGVGGQITGGRGNGYGGDAMMLMNVDGSASIALTGSLTGGDSSGADSDPGQSLTLLGARTAMHTNVGPTCILQNGRQLLYSLGVTPLPAITAVGQSPSPAATPAPKN